VRCRAVPDGHPFRQHRVSTASNVSCSQATCGASALARRAEMSAITGIAIGRLSTVIGDSALHFYSDTGIVVLWRSECRKRRRAWVFRIVECVR
jgi:hypothetical protein